MLQSGEQTYIHIKLLEFSLFLHFLLFTREPTNTLRLLAHFLKILITYK